MYSLTQGTIITGVRSDKYSNIRCNGVVISARCDLANCKISKIYYLIAVPSDDWLLSDEGFNIVLSQRQNDLEDKNVEKLSSLLGKKMYVLKNRQTSSLSRSIKTDDPIILSDPYNVNGLEFKCVILFGVDEGRLPQNTGVSDISANYIKYIAFNQLYLASSRAKYRLILIGNSLHGVSSCLQYALESGKLETGDQV